MALTMPKGYCTHGDIEKRLGIGMTPDQVALCQALIAAAESFIDVNVRRGDPLNGAGGWLNGPIADERYELRNVGQAIYLRSTPVDSVQSVVVRSHSVGDKDTTLVDGVDYELQDPAKGMLVLATAYGIVASYYDYGGTAGYNEAGRLVGAGLSATAYAKVSYTPRQVVPPDIREAAAILAAHWLEYSINPGRYGLTSLTIQTYKYQMMTDGKGQRVLPQEALDIIARRSIIVF